MLKKKLPLFVLSLLLLATLTRFLWLGSIPYGLHADEASFLLNTYSISVTGKDEDGQTLPIWLNSYIDPKPALYSYLQLPFVALLGPTTLASRIPAAILGLISLGLSYWVTRFFFTRKHAALITFLLVISPWHIVVSRSTQEVILAFVFSLIAIGSYLQIKSKAKRKALWLAILVLSAGLAFYSYHSAKIFLPGLFLGWTALEWYFSKQEKKSSVNLKLLAAATIGVIIMMLGITFMIPESLTRFNAIGLFSERGPQLIADEQIRTATGVTPLFLLRVFYNKVVTYGLTAIQLYTQHFSIDFLFLNGGEPKRYLIPFHGVLYLVELLLLPLGLFIGLHQPKQRRSTSYFLLWLLIAPLPAALTSQEVPSTIRAFMMIVPLIVCISIAVLWLWRQKNIWSNLALVCIAGGYLWGAGYFMQQFGVQQAHYHPWYRNRGEEQLAEYVLSVKDSYQIIDVSTIRDLYVYLTLLDHSLLPELQSLTHEEKLDHFKLGNIYFNSRGCELHPYQKTDQAIQILQAGCTVPEGYSVVRTIRYDDLAEVYAVLEYSGAEELN